MKIMIGTRRTSCLGNFGSGRSGGPNNLSYSTRNNFSVAVCSMLSQRAMTLLLALAALGAAQTLLYGQARPVGEQRAGFGVIATVNAENSQLPYYADNAMGYGFGAFLQLTPLLGVEGRISSYPVSATFAQAPYTAGVRVAPPQTKEVQLVPFFYFGGGYSHAEYSKANYKPSVPLWTPCWQASAGTDLGFSRFRWRMYELNWNETYASRQNIRTIGLSTGLVWTFKH